LWIKAGQAKKPVIFSQNPVNDRHQLAFLVQVYPGQALKPQVLPVLEIRPAGLVNPDSWLPGENIIKGNKEPAR